MNDSGSSPLERASWRTFFLVTAALFAWFVVRPLFAPVVLAILAAVVFAPLHGWMERRLGRQRIRAATASMIVLGFGVGAPAVWLAVLFVAQTRALLRQLLGEEAVRSKLVKFLHDGMDWLAFEARVLGTEIDFTGLGDQLTRQAAETASAFLPDVLGFTGELFFGFAVFNVVLFVLFLRGLELLGLVVELAPFVTAHSLQILRRLQVTIQGVFLGGILTAILQGTVGAFGFWLIGFENYVIWGMLISGASFLPVLGTALIWLPVVITQWLSGHTAAASGMLAVGIVISTVDNLARALFIHRRSDVHPLLILLALLGALRTTGLMGLVYGPLLAACLTEAVRIYRVEFTDRLPWGGQRAGRAAAGTTAAEPVGGQGSGPDGGREPG